MAGAETKLKVVKTHEGDEKWEVFLTDPSLNKFMFGPSLIGPHIMTDIISPQGQKSVKYNTLPEDEEKVTTDIVIRLNFEDIDDCSITNIKFTIIPNFFKKWEVILVDNRNGKTYPIKESMIFKVDPPIVCNKLYGVGFLKVRKRPNLCFFELRLKSK